MYSIVIFFINESSTTESYTYGHTLSLHDALPISVRDAGVTQLDGHDHAFGGIAQQKRQPEEQQHHADPQHGITAKQPVTHARQGTLEQIRTTRDSRLRLNGFGGDRYRPPYVVGQRLAGLCSHRGTSFKVRRQ